MSGTILIGDHRVGPGERVFCICEAGINHNGRIDLALKLVDAAKRAGASCVKFQTFSADRIIKPDTPMYRMCAPLELSHGQFRAIKAHCDEVGITFLSTPDDEQDADFLDELVPAFKVGSGNLRNLPLLRHVAAKGKPIILSTGMGDREDVQRAITAVRWGCEDSAGWCDGLAMPLVLLHCCSVYLPLDYDGRSAWWDPSMVNLRAMDTLAQFGYPVGFSDHSPVPSIVLAAVARGACVIERHLKLAETRGPDVGVSIDEQQFGLMVAQIRNVEAALGDGVKRPADAELETWKGIQDWRKGGE